MKSKTKHYIVTIKIRSKLGTKPICKTLFDCVFCHIDEGQIAYWKLKRDWKGKR